MKNSSPDVIIHMHIAVIHSITEFNDRSYLTFVFFIREYLKLWVK